MRGPSSGAVVVSLVVGIELDEVDADQGAASGECLGSAPRERAAARVGDDNHIRSGIEPVQPALQLIGRLGEDEARARRLPRSGNAR